MKNPLALRCGRATAAGALAANKLNLTQKAAIGRPLRQSRDNTASFLEPRPAGPGAPYSAFLPAVFMPLTLTDIDRIAHLARLDLSGEQSARMLVQLNGFFDLVEAMRAVDTTGVQPLAHPLAAVREVQLRLHEDTVSEPATTEARAANMQNAPAAEDGLFLVPKVIE
jgi:aspartyl-tRNA(Asn)/glutamyl-tRNA(Gln) amidotransferase subunit C